VVVVVYMASCWESWRIVAMGAWGSGVMGHGVALIDSA
jgi:hypothetical protein